MQQQVVKTNLQRWSLQALGAQKEVSSSISAGLLACVVDRLDYQHKVVEDVLQWVPRQQPAVKRLETIAYIHKDTARAGKNLLENGNLWNRYSSADRHLINSTFLEIRARHANSVEASVEILSCLRDHWQEEIDNVVGLPHGDAFGANLEDNYFELHEALESFLRRRLGVQLLCDQHAELYERSRSIVTFHAPIVSFVDHAVTEAQHIVDAHLQIKPEVKVYGQASGAVIRPWLHHSLVEVLKNAMAAVIVQAKKEEGLQSSILSNTPPPVLIHVDQDDTGISIEIVDRGTGIETGEHVLVGLGHSSALKRWDRLDEQQSYAAVRSPLSSLGVGLKVARYHMQHFGGNIDVSNNAEGRGCTATVFIPTDESIPEEFPLHDGLSLAGKST